LIRSHRAWRRRAKCTCFDGGSVVNNGFSAWGLLLVNIAARQRRWKTWLITICACAVFSVSGTARAAEYKRVIILHSVGREFRPWNEYAKGIREELDKQSSWPLDVQEHALVAARSGDPNPEEAFVTYLRALYARHQPDLIVSIGSPAALFIQRNRQLLFPTTPVLITALEQRRVQSSSLTENDTVVAGRINFRFLFESFLQTAPDTRIVAVVNGSSPNELYWQGEIKRELKPLEDRIEIRWYDKLSFEDMMKQMASLPPHSAIYWFQMVVDAAGVAHEGDRALTSLYATANAPIFTHDDAFFGREIVGGPMISALALSRSAAAVAIRILSGEKAGDIKTEPADFAAPKYDWRELRRWGISERHLISNSKVYFREPTAWDKYRAQILLVSVLILVQAAMISGLLRERHRRQIAEVQSRRRMSELARVNRFSTAGELTTSIAHEINQPLGAIRTNAETMDLILGSSSPDLDEIKTIVADIRRDEERATEVIRRIRSLLSKTPFELSDVDLNEIAHEAAEFFSALAVARHVELSVSITPMPLPIRGDRIQLQQVILNLITNGMDAMTSLPSTKRKLLVATARDGKFAEVSVSDLGPGVPLDKLKEIFEPLFTTKAHGMGVGLSIARTIVEAHGGWIWAENKLGGGAAFRIKLPLSGD
jgi:signal transduction histidine kinase